MFLRNYKIFNQIIQRPLNYFLSLSSFSQHQESLVSLTHSQPQNKQKERKKKTYFDLTHLDQMIFKSSKPSLKFLESSYGKNARISYLDKKEYNQDILQNFSNYHYEREQQYSNKLSQSLLVVPIFMIGAYQLSESQDAQCFFFRKNEPNLQKNTLEKRTVVLQYAANLPIEDRYKATQLKNINGFAVSVFDGHGGWQVAELAMKLLHDEFDRCLLENTKKYQDQDDYIQYSLKQAHERVEKEFYKLAIEAYQMGFANVARVGACALTAVISGDHLYSANLGDCKGIIVNLQSSTPTFRKINHMLNANSKKEQLRLRTLFTEDDDIVVCRNEKGACYVKNRLQPTRALGDFRLKYPEFNNPLKEPREKGYAEQIQKFRGPYIESVPDQKKFKLERGDRYLVLGSDGLWDELTKQQIAEICKENAGDKDKITKAIFERSLQHAASEHKMTQDQLKSIPLGKRRKLHDDITIIVVDLYNQA